MIIIQILVQICLIIYVKSDECYVLKDVKQKVKPSLSFCYKNNDEACCNSMTDQQISEKMSNLMTQMCQIKFPALQTYFCLACYSNEYEFANQNTKVIKLCQSFVEQIWQTDINQPTYIFDQCGFSISGNPAVPSSQYSTAYNFLNSYIPYPYNINGFTIQIVSDNQNCFKFSHKIYMSIMTILMILFNF